MAWPSREHHVVVTRSDSDGDDSDTTLISNQAGSHHQSGQQERRATTALQEIKGNSPETGRSAPRRPASTSLVSARKRFEPIVSGRSREVCCAAGRRVPRGRKSQRVSGRLNPRSRRSGRDPHHQRCWSSPPAPDSGKERPTRKLLSCCGGDGSACACIDEGCSCSYLRVDRRQGRDHDENEVSPTRPLLADRPVALAHPAACATGSRVPSQA